MGAVAVARLAAGDEPAQQLLVSQLHTPLVGPCGHGLTLSHAGVVTATLARLAACSIQLRLRGHPRLAGGDLIVELGEDFGLAGELGVVGRCGRERSAGALVLGPGGVDVTACSSASAARRLASCARWKSSSLCTFGSGMRPAA